VRYKEEGEIKFRIEQDFSFPSFQSFVKDKDVVSITFYANGMIDPVGHISHEKRIYEEQLTKEEFLQVNRGWLEAE
jgi:hypothetical protein